jgi:hypothetical protein
MLTGEWDLGATRSVRARADVAQLGLRGRGQPPGQRLLVRRDKDLPDVPAGGGHQGGGDPAVARVQMFERLIRPEERRPRRGTEHQQPGASSATTFSPLRNWLNGISCTPRTSTRWP